MISPTFQAMTLAAKHIRLVQQSWRALRDVNAQFIGDLFYSRLFFEHPEARALFPKDMAAQHQKLIDMINVVVARLEYLDTLTDELEALGRRHEEYGTLPHHYGWVGESLLWTLERGLGDDWTPSVQEAWTNCYTTLSNAMLRQH